MNAISASNAASMATNIAGRNAGASVTVQRGDTMSAIAAKHHVPLQAMIDANPQIGNPDKIYPGDVLTVPTGGGNETQGRQENVQVTVRSNDTLSAIAARHDVPLQTVIDANPHVAANPDLIRTGDVVTVPTGRGGASAADERGAGDAMFSPFAQAGEWLRSQFQGQSAAVPVPAEKPAAPVSAASASSDISLNSLNLEQRTLRAMNYFIDQGWEPHQAAGIVGNLLAESQLDTTVKGDGGISIGIAQWNNYKNDPNGRRASLEKFAKAQGKDWENLDVQLAYVQHELMTSEGYAGNLIKNANNVQEANDGMIAFEKPKGYSKNNAKNAHNYKGRLEYSNDSLNRWQSQNR